ILCILSTLCIRFIFPQWSLEGKSFWIIRLSPVSLKKIYIEKFIFSMSLVAGLSVFLITISNFMLNLETTAFLLILGIIAVSSFTMVSLSLGLGAYFADFSQDYYLRSVESFGGFIALVFNFAYIILTVLIFTWITYANSSAKLFYFKQILAIVFVSWSILSFVLSFIANTKGLSRLREKEY
ncbi:MAG: hypothetical protein JW867_01105, partial [Candidatus Omnitrophica bacterium]|nr:hypothetical protein [Candidatus Omnitrophota bacterium]